MSFASAAEHSNPDKPRVVVPIHCRPDRPESVVARKRSKRAALKITALGEMTSGIAHDFRNILCIISSGLNVAERHSGDPEKLESALTAIREGVARGIKVTDRLLALAKRQKPETGPQDLNTLLGKLKAFLNYGAGPGVRLILELAPGLPKCLVDPPQFNSAILNLVVNARDAMPNGGIVRISTTASHTNSDLRYVKVRVSDDGVGMSAEVTKRIFDPYFTTKGDSGTGLGVPQVQALMRQVGGYVTVNSVVGRGTSFDLFFPVHEERPAAAAAADAQLQLDRWADEGGAIVTAKSRSAI